MPAGDVFGLDGFFLNVSNPVVVSTIGINSTGSSAGIIVTDGVLNTTAGIATLTLSTAAGLSTTPFYTGAKIAVSGLSVSGVAHTGYNGTFVVTGFAGTTTVSYATTGYFGSVTASITGQTGLVMLVTDTQVTNTTWSSAQTHGWFGGGSSPAVVSTVDRIDFSNDTGTANIRGPLTLARNYPTATGNSNYGWFGGGLTPSPSAFSTVERIDFSNDSSTASPRGPLSLAKYSHAATGNSNYGWFGGGAPGNPVYLSIVDRIDFSNDSATSSPRGPLSQARSASATGNSSYGWFGGGLAPAVVSTVDRIDFSNDSPAASVRGPLSAGRYSIGATGNSNYGLWVGGGAGPGPVTIVNRIDFSNDNTTASVRGSLITKRGNIGASANSNYGWFGGGADFTVPAIYEIVDRIDFSNDLVATSPRGRLSLARWGLGATSGQARSSSVRLAKIGGYGWWSGGVNFLIGPNPPYVLFSGVDRIDFSNDSATASPRAVMSRLTGSGSGLSNVNYGWFVGGSNPGNSAVSLVDRINFSNDLSTPTPRALLSITNSYKAGVSNSNYGWYAGPAVFRMNFSNDVENNLTRGPLTSPFRSQSGATGNSNYGWWAGGQSPGPPYVGNDTVDRINFSNDSTSSLPRGPLSAARYTSGATGNSNYGWFGGGTRNGGATGISLVDRIDFSNDSTSSLPRGFLLTARMNLIVGATGNKNYGWWGGGSTATQAASAVVNRIDFSNDSVTASPRGALNSARSLSTATSNTPT